MTILFDLRPALDAPLGGIGRITLELALAWLTTAPEDRLIFFSTGWKKPELPARLQAHQPEHWHFRIPNKLWNLGCLLRIVSLPARLRFRFPNADALFLPNLTFLGSLNRSTLPIHLLLHDLSFFIEPRWFSWKQRLWHILTEPKKCIRSVQSVWTVSKRTANDAHAWIKTRATPIPIGPTEIGRALAAQSKAHSPQPRTILIFGATDARKNAKGAIAAVHQLKENPAFADLECRFAFGSDSELIAQLQSASAILIPSWYEGYNLPLMEAAPAGIPVISGLAGAPPETAPPGTIFVPAAKPHLIAAGLELALTRPRPIAIQLTEEHWAHAIKTIRKSLS